MTVLFIELKKLLVKNINAYNPQTKIELITINTQKLTSTLETLVKKFQLQPNNNKTNQLDPKNLLKTNAHYLPIQRVPNNIALFKKYSTKTLPNKLPNKYTPKLPYQKPSHSPPIQKQIKHLKTKNEQISFREEKENK